jgi:hypothetical protein
MFYLGALFGIPFIETILYIGTFPIHILVIAEVSTPDFEKMLVLPHDGLGVKPQNLGCGQLVSKGGKWDICQRASSVGLI